jgi:apolipoprotein N-acyltransferase
MDRQDRARDWKAWSWLWLALGAGLFTFIGWKFNVPFAAWAAPIFLIRFFRDTPRWTATLAVVPALALASFIQLVGGWDLEAWMVVAVSFLRPAALIAGLYADRALNRRLPAAAATLVFPAVVAAAEWAVSLAPLGSGMASAATQFAFPAVSQLASITGIWGIGFLAAWTGAVANAAWEHRARLREVRGPVIAWAAVVLCVVGLGSARLALARPEVPTVRVGSVTIPHQRDYWTWIDKGTPRDLIARYTGELSAMEEQLFAQSERAADAGARVIFWSEGNGVITEDNEDRFMARASELAKRRQVYFAPAVVVLRYGSGISDNKLVMFSPDGSRSFTYVKTISWYPTGSDGTLKYVDTRFGRIGAAICFDMDFPGFIHRLGALGADIVLVPAYDKEKIRPYHTEVGLLRGIENGFSVIRQTNEGTSMAVDGAGRTLARQEFFETADRLMLADVPTRRLSTVYARLGEWFPWAAIALALGLVGWGVAREARRRR